MPRAPKKQLDNLASILRLIRGGMDTRESLYSHFGLSLHVIRTEQFILNEHIKRLATAGIITIQHDNGGETFRISEHWLEIQNLLVFYEIGIAHTLGRPVILITQDPEDVPFDLRHLRYIHYELTPRGMKTFEETLAETLASELRLAST